MGNFRDMVMIGRVKIPSDVPRDDYVIHALKTQTACVELANGDFIKDCRIAWSFCGFNDGFIHTLDFPRDTKEAGSSGDRTQKELGSIVVLLNVPDSDIPIIIGCLSQRNSPLTLEEEKMLKLSRESDTGSFLIEGSALSGLLKMIVTSTTAEGGKIDISTLNDFNTGEIKFTTNNLILEGTESIQFLTESLFQILIRNLETKEEFTTIKYEFGVGFTFTDEFGNEYKTVDGITTIEAEEIKLGTGATEAVALGDTLKGILDEILDAINLITVPTPMGVSGTPLNFAVFETIKAKLDTILSTKSKVE